MKPLILFVDDNPNVLAALARTFRNEAYEILTVQSAEEALQLIRGIRVHVIVCDQQMPGLSGTEFLSYVSEHFPEITRIMLTGDTSLDVAMDAINRGEIFRYFRKPYNEIDLGIAIRQGIRHHRLLDGTNRLIQALRQGGSQLKRLEESYPGISQVKRDRDGAIQLSPRKYNLDELIEELELEILHHQHETGDTF
ncbi:MAG: response regulator [Bdellovibrionales bacterium]|nr:response regulator [Bdellovibrionales bacterium]